MFKLGGLNRKKFSWNVVFLRKLFYCFQLNLCATSVLLSKTIWLMSSMMRVSWCSWWTTEKARSRKKCLFCSKNSRFTHSLNGWSWKRSFYQRPWHIRRLGGSKCKIFSQGDVIFFSSSPREEVTYETLLHEGIYLNVKLPGIFML